MLTLDLIQRSSYTKQSCYRLIPSRFPPIDLFEDVASQDDFEAIFAIQALTNPRIQDEIGDLSLVPQEERLYGAPGCGYIMAAFTHINPDGSRFSNGDYGVYYAAEREETAIIETVYHRERFLSYTKEPAQELDMRTLIAEFSADLYDLLHFDKQNHSLYSASDYSQGQALGATLKEKSGEGFVYHSVRSKTHADKNFALFKPRSIHQCIQGSHYSYVWDGKKISTIYKKSVQSILSNL